MPPERCPACGHTAHHRPCARRGPVECRAVATEAGTARVRGQWPCGCPYRTKVCGCGARLVLATTAAGKDMPVERGSANAPDGTLAVRRETPGGALTARVLGKDEEPGAGEWRGRTHWGRCPKEQDYRRRK